MPITNFQRNKHQSRLQQIRDAPKRKTCSFLSTNAWQLLHCTRQSSHKITISGLIEADVLKQIKCGRQFDGSFSIVWLKYQDYEMEWFRWGIYDSCIGCYTLKINSRLHVPEWCKLDSFRLWQWGRPLGCNIYSYSSRKHSPPGGTHYFFYTWGLSAWACTWTTPPRPPCR